MIPLIKEHLPAKFHMNTVEWAQADQCQLCGKGFSKLKMNGRHHCRRCGRSVCENCSKDNKLQLSQNDPNLYRCCDACAARIENLDVVAEMKDRIGKMRNEKDRLENVTRKLNEELIEEKEKNGEMQSILLNIDSRIE